MQQIIPATSYNASTITIDTHQDATPLLATNSIKYNNTKSKQSAKAKAYNKEKETSSNINSNNSSISKQKMQQNRKYLVVD